MDNQVDNRVDNRVDNLADNRADGIHKKVRNLNTIKSEVHFRLFGIMYDNLMMIQTFHYYEFWVSFFICWLGNQKNLLYFTHI